MKLLVDNNLAPRLARAMNLIVNDDGHFVQPVKDKIKGSPSDIEIAHELAKEPGWALLTEDKNILKTPSELTAFMEGNITIFVFNKNWSSSSNWEKLGHTIKAWPTILSLYEDLPLDKKGAAFEIVYRQTVKIRRVK
ncbi:MAG: hypothetical protein ACREJ2_19140 [Planctomycetota bacterium]